jgi:dolichyl-diphosphooligosaccharide--protein glycosyltransferase
VENLFSRFPFILFSSFLLSCSHPHFFPSLSFSLFSGMYFCFKKLSDVSVFCILYGLLSVYFAGVMVRLMLVLAPAACILAAIAISETYESFFNLAEADQQQDKKSEESLPRSFGLAIAMGLCFLTCAYQFHCTWVTSEAYSSPSIVLAARSNDGGRIIFDDFREAYYWLRHNTAEDARIMSWWDYGYQITAMANRTVLVDNNTWNNTHIATVGMMMASSEETAYPIMKRLDVDYVLVIFGGLTGYSSDDINKFLWMVRIGGGVYPQIVEKDYFTSNGDFRVDAAGSKTLLNSLMYKLCYYRFGEVYTEYNKPTGFDRVRSSEIGNKDFQLVRSSSLSSGVVFGFSFLFSLFFVCVGLFG